MASNKIKLSSIITCPECGFSIEEEMAKNACAFTYEYCNCKKLLYSLYKKGCIFCSYGDTPCPPVQQGEDCC